MPDQPPEPVQPELSPVVWRRLYVAAVIYGVLTIAALWWFTAAYAR